MKTPEKKRRKQPNWRFSVGRQKSIRKAQQTHILVCRLGMEALRKKGKKTVQQVREN